MNRSDIKEYIIIGAGGHAAVVADILYSCGYPVRGFLDDAVSVGIEILGAAVLGKVECCTDHRDALFIIGIGDNSIRERIASKYNLEYGIAVHPLATIGREVEIGCGTVLMAGSIVNPRTAVGRHCIINTKASIDHDNRIDDYVHISPGAALGGTVAVGKGTHIGIGSSVKNNITICDDVIVGVGAAVVNDIIEPGTYMGVPARMYSIL